MLPYSVNRNEASDRTAWKPLGLITRISLNRVFVHIQQKNGTHDSSTSISYTSIILS